MIDAGYVLTMSRYNAWQNSQIMDVVKVMDEAEVALDRGAFFGSIQATLNHILWADTLWMSRFAEDVAPPAVAAAENLTLTPNIAAWSAARSDMDSELIRWSEALTDADLEGPLNWYSGTLGRDMTTPKAKCITHMFNHQIHHRGQVHAMLTQAGQKAPVSDLIFMPETD